MKGQNTLEICRCLNCPGEIEFEADRIGETIACPHCGMETTLFRIPKEQIQAPAPSPPARETLASAHRVSKRERLSLWTILEIIGYIIFTPAAIVSGIFLIIFVADGRDISFGSAILFLGGLLIPTVAGLLLIFTAQRCSTKWLCSNCRNRLTDKDAKMCAVCHLPLS